MVLVPGCGGGWEDCVPDNGLGGRFGRLKRGIDGLDVEENLFCVPVEECAQIYLTIYVSAPFHQFYFSLELGSQNEEKKDTDQYPDQIGYAHIPPSYNYNSVAALSLLVHFSILYSRLVTAGL